MAGEGVEERTQDGVEAVDEAVDEAVLRERDRALSALAGFHPQDDESKAIGEHYHEFVSTTPRALLRENLEGHVTASAFVLDEGRESLLLIWHRGLGRWLQPGGHADGDGDLVGVAQREVEEETGLAGLRLLIPYPYDLDIHLIPEGKKAGSLVPEHLHYDARFVFEASRQVGLRPDPRETGGAQWLPLRQVVEEDFDHSIQRVVARLLGAPPR
ncbi:MAG: NUDIX hydrolase [Acidobacteriota bacterium]